MIFIIAGGLILLAVGVITFVALVIVLLTAGRRSGGATLLWASLCALPVTVLVLLFSWWLGPADLTSPKALATAYKTEFGTYPPADVADIQARQVVVGDSGGAWLRFRASKTTIDGLLTKFTTSDRAAFSRAGQGGNVPGWWKPEADHVDTFYKAEHWSHNFRYSAAWLGLNRETGVVYFSHSGFD